MKFVASQGSRNMKLFKNSLYRNPDHNQVSAYSLFWLTIKGQLPANIFRNYHANLRLSHSQMYIFRVAVFPCLSVILLSAMQGILESKWCPLWIDSPRSAMVPQSCRICGTCCWTALIPTGNMFSNQEFAQ
jgi:hypothetical protein